MKLDVGPILIAEDDEDHSFLIGEALRAARLANPIVNVRDGDQAIAFLSAEPPFQNESKPEFVLLDLHMPGRSGLDVLRWIRAHEQHRDIPVIVLSASSEDGHIRASYDAGASYYLVKPVGFDALLDVVRNLGLEWVLTTPRRDDAASLGDELWRAVANDELRLEYQPIIDLRTQAVTGVEALVRWEHPEHGMIQPNDFIPQAEANGAINDLGRWVLRRACTQLRRWRDEHAHLELYVSVNIASRQLQQSDIVAQVRDIIVDAHVSPHDVSLEITESGLLPTAGNNIARLHALRALGVRIAIDDFGTGYSTLSYLRQLPVDTVKIDRSFVSGIATASSEWSMVQSVVRLNETLGLQTVAEGVEQASQLTHLRALGCRYAQGFYFAKPEAPGAIDARLRAAG